MTQALLVLALFVMPSRNINRVLLGVQLIIAGVCGVIHPIGMFTLVLFWGFCEYHYQNAPKNRVLNGLQLIAIIIVTLAFANHLIPGFAQSTVFDAIHFSAQSSSYTQILTSDKTMAAVILAMTAGIISKQSTSWNSKRLLTFFTITMLAIFVLGGIARLGGFIAFDPKFPEHAWIWIVSNLLFTCFAEEIIFRGMIQHHLMILATRWKVSPWVPIVISSFLFTTLLFGHLYAGPIYILLVFLAGIFYGYTYYLTNRIEAAIGVHFLVNLCHFLLFTYPMVLAR
jgi:hypothetical protein